jgi:formylglycine-generating enzyme required for sulfatase activity
VGFTQHDEYPAVNVSHRDAAKFCNWLSRREGATYRLLREEEWRSLQGTSHLAGELLSECEDYHWYESIAANHPAFRAFKASVWSELGAGDRAARISARVEAPVAVRAALRAWNLVGDPAGAYGFRIVRVY